MKKQILKRHGNYILRTREIDENRIVYTWFYSKKLSQILKSQGFIENWQLDSITETLNEHEYVYFIDTFKQYQDFRYIFKYIQKDAIKDLLQYSNKTGKYAEIRS